MPEKNKTLIVLAESQLFKTRSSDVVVSKLSEHTGIEEDTINAKMRNEQVKGAMGGIFAGCFGSSCGFSSFINDYKKGEIGTDDFYEEFRDRLRLGSDQLSDDTIKDCWNSMCEFSEQAKTESVNVARLLTKNKDTHIVFVNETNQLQHEENFRQFKEALGEESFKQIKGQIHFVNSHEINSLGDKKRLASEGVKVLQTSGQLPSNDQIESVVSLHKDMKSQSILDEGKNVSTVRKNEGKFLDIKTNGESDMFQKIEESLKDIEKTKGLVTQR